IKHELSANNARKQPRFASTATRAPEPDKCVTTPNRHTQPAPARCWPGAGLMLVVYMRLDAAAARYLHSLPATWAPLAYRARLARKTSATARVQSLAGLWLLQQALTLTGRAAAVLQGIGFSAHDRPRLADGPAFSISHSARFAACAITEAEAGARQVGLDIEEPRPVAPARMARLLGTDEERALVAQQPELFFDYWCAREATVKASG